MQHQTFSSRPPAPKPIAIEVDGEPLGVVIPADEGFRFLAVKLNAFAVDGKIFTTVEAARDAVSAVVHIESDEE
jgi:hypothetical protein